MNAFGNRLIVGEDLLRPGGLASEDGQGRKPLAVARLLGLVAVKAVDPKLRARSQESGECGGIMILHRDIGGN